MTSTVETGKMSSRGQVAIPQDIREKMNLKEGEKILFLLEDDSLLIKKVSSMSWDEITNPLRKADKNIESDEVSDVVEEVRK